MDRQTFPIAEVRPRWDLGEKLWVKWVMSCKTNKVNVLILSPFPFNFHNNTSLTQDETGIAMGVSKRKVIAGKGTKVR